MTRRPWLLVTLAYAACFIQSWNHRAFGTPRDFYRLATEAAAEKGVKVEDYLDNVNSLQKQFLRSKDVVDRTDLMEALTTAMMSQDFTLLLGPKSVGKTRIRKEVISRLESEKKVTIIDVNMRERPSEELLEALLAEATNKGSKDPAWVQIIKAINAVSTNIASFVTAITVGTNSESIAPAAAGPIANAVGDIIAKMTREEKEKTLLELIKAFKASGNETCIVVDEANLALPMAGDAEMARNALAVFVMLTKESRQASVVLFSSELAFPYRLEACGMNLWDIGQIIIANEVSKDDMLNMMTGQWNMSQDLAELFFSTFGGHIELCCRGVEKLREFGEDFDPLTLLKVPGLPNCAADPDARNHLRNLAKQGWSPVYNILNDEGAKLIEKNAGGIIPKDATAFDLLKGIWKGHDCDYALIPSGTLMRWKIAQELERRLACLKAKEMFRLFVLRRVSSCDSGSDPKRTSSGGTSRWKRFRDLFRR